MIKSCKTTGVPFSSFHFKSSSEFLLLLHFQRTHQSSSYCYTFTSHACNLDYWFIYNFLLSFDYFQVTIQHDTIEVHEYCWASLKDSSDFFSFLWYSSSTWVITNFSCYTRHKWHTCLIKRWSNWTYILLISNIVFTIEGQKIILQW